MEYYSKELEVRHFLKEYASEKGLWYWSLITQSSNLSFPGADKIVLWAFLDVSLKMDNPIKDEFKGKERKKF